MYRVGDQAKIVRTTGADRPLMLSGDGDGIVDLASIGAVDPSTPILSSAAFDGQQIREATQPASMLVVTDSNRLRARRWSTVTDTVGYTEGPGNHPIRFDESDSRLDLFPDASPDATTQVHLRGATRVGATSYGNPISYNPEDRAALAFDGDVQTAWRTGAFSDVRGERILVEATGPITTDSVNLVQVMRPPRDRWITKATLRFDGGDPVTVELGDASRTAEGQTISFPKRTFRTFSIEIRDTNLGELRNYGGIDPVGFAEVRLPGPDGNPLRVSEVTVLPTDLTAALAEESATHPLVYTMRRERVIPVPPRRDPELAMTRQITVPTERGFGVGLETRLSSWAPDDLIDVRLGYSGGLRATASARLAGAPQHRASAAVDGNRATAWVTPFDQVTGQSLSLGLPAPRTIDRLNLEVVADGKHSTPRRLTLRNEGGEARVLTVPRASAGEAGIARTPLEFPALRGTDFTVTIDEVRPVVTREWFCECDQVMPVGIAELGIPDIAPIRVPAEIPNDCRTDLLVVDGNPVPGRVVGSTAAALALEPLRVEQCDQVDRPTLQLAAGPHELSTGPGDETGWNVDRLVLASGEAGTPMVLGSGAAATVTTIPSAPGPELRIDAQGRSTIRATVTATGEPFWLVLGQSLNPGWRATVDGRDLGPPTLVNGFANGWRVEPSGESAMAVTFEWTPQRTVNLALGLSLAALLVIAGILVVAGTRRRRDRYRRRTTDLALLEAPPVVSPPDAEFQWPWRQDLAEPSAARALAAAALAGAFGFLVAGPIVGGVAVLATLAARWSHLVRLALRMAPAIGLAACGAFLAAKQIYARYPATFEWPTFFSEVQTVGWLVVVLLVADGLLGGRSRPASWAHSAGDDADLTGD